MNPKIILCFALALSSGMSGCSTDARRGSDSPSLNTAPRVVDCGPAPTNYQASIKTQLLAELKIPGSDGYGRSADSVGFAFEKPYVAWGPRGEPCWIVKVWLNFKDLTGETSSGWTGGGGPFWFYYRGNTNIAAVKPPAVPQTKWLGTINPLRTE